MNTPSLLTAAAALLALTACERNDDGVAKQASDAATVTPKAARAPIDAQELKKPCAWLTSDEVAGVFGPVAAQPYRVTDTENVRAHASGRACAYPITSDRGGFEFVVQVDPEGAPELESASNMMAYVISKEMSEDGHGETPERQTRSDGWDTVKWIAGERLYRVGHLAIRMSVTTSMMEDEPLDRLALLLRERIADKPFLNPGSNPNAEGTVPDPCDLLTRTEAEAVLGPLAVAPYRSLERSAVAHSNGPSCAYYTPNHRTFVIHPTYSDGKDRFQMSMGFGSLVRSGVGGADEGDLLEGPWEAASAGTTGELHFLDGDAMLEVIYATSATDIEGAAKLAAIAVPRLKDAL